MFWCCCRVTPSLCRKDYFSESFTTPADLHDWDPDLLYTGIWMQGFQSRASFQGRLRIGTAFNFQPSTAQVCVDPRLPQPINYEMYAQCRFMDNENLAPGTLPVTPFAQLEIGSGAGYAGAGVFWTIADQFQWRFLVGTSPVGDGPIWQPGDLVKIHVVRASAVHWEIFFYVNGVEELLWSVPAGDNWLALPHLWGFRAYTWPGNTQTWGIDEFFGYAAT